MLWRWTPAPRLLASSASQPPAAPTSTRRGRARAPIRPTGSNAGATQLQGVEGAARLPQSRSVSAPALDSRWPRQSLAVSGRSCTALPTLPERGGGQQEPRGRKEQRGCKGEGSGKNRAPLALRMSRYTFWSMSSSSRRLGSPVSCMSSPPKLTYTCTARRGGGGGGARGGAGREDRCCWACFWQAPSRRASFRTEVVQQRGLPQGKKRQLAAAREHASQAPAATHVRLELPRGAVVLELEDLPAMKEERVGEEVWEPGGAVGPSRGLSSRQPNSSVPCRLQLQALCLLRACTPHSEQPWPSIHNTPPRPSGCPRHWPKPGQQAWSPQPLL